MTDLIFNQIINPVDQYWGYKHSNYLKTLFVPKFVELNKLNIPLTKDQLKKLESKICTGKSKSLLADSLYNHIDILDVITKNNVLSEKFIQRIVDILVKYKEKCPNVTYNFSWVYNLKKNGYIFSNDISKDLSSIDFKSTDIINQKCNSTELEFITKILSYVDNLIDLKDFLSKNPNFTPNSTNIKFYFDNLNVIYFQKNPPLINCYNYIYNLYELLLQNKYQITENDMNYIFNSFIQYMDLVYKMYSFENSNQNLLNIQKILELFNKNNIYFNQSHINKFITYTSNIKIHYGYNSHKRYLEYILLFKSIIELHMKNKNNILEKSNYIDYLSFNTSTQSICNVIVFGKSYKEHIMDILRLLNTNNLINVTNITLNKVLIKGDSISLDFILDNNLVVPDEQTMNIACFSGNVEIIKKFINNKFIPTLSNIYSVKNFSSEIIKLLIDYGGLVVTDELMEFFISKNIKLADLEKHGYDTPEKKELIKEFSIKYRKFPYQNEFPNEFENIFTTMNNANFSIYELEEYIPKFDNDNKIKALFDLFVTNNNLECIYYLKEKYPNIKPSNNVIYMSYYCDMYLDLFDLKK
jgi:hypothetical protein